MQKEKTTRENEKWGKTHKCGGNGESPASGVANGMIAPGLANIGTDEMDPYMALTDPALYGIADFSTLEGGSNKGMNLNKAYPNEDNK